MANPVQIADALHVDGTSPTVGVTTAQEARSSVAALVAHDGSGPRLGIFYEGNQNLIAGTSTTAPSMQVSVSPVAFCGQKALAEGVYIGRSTGTVLVDIAAAPASNSRIDTVYVMQRDSHSTTSPDGLTQGEIGVVTGTAGVSPTAPAAPAGAVVIGTVQVAAGVTATTNAGCTIITTCPYTAAAGAPIPTRSQAGRDALTAYDGLQVYRFDTHRVETYNGTTWLADFDVYTGSEGVIKGSVPPAGTRVIRYRGSSIVSTNSGGEFSVNFPSTFPNGLVTFIAIAGDQVLRTVVVDQAGTAGLGSAFAAIGFAYNGANALLTSTNVRVNWIAEGW